LKDYKTIFILIIYAPFTHELRVLIITILYNDQLYLNLQLLNRPIIQHFASQNIQRQNDQIVTIINTLEVSFKVKDYTFISWSLPLRCISSYFIHGRNYLVWDWMDIKMFI